jgi:required for meiotic nuclear division protein 1
MTPASEPSATGSHGQLLKMRAVILGERLDHRQLQRVPGGTVDPVQVALPGAPLVFAFRWGAVVIADASPEMEREVLAKLRPLVSHPLATPIEESATIQTAAAEDGVDANGVIQLTDATVPRLAVVADALAKSAALAYQENSLSETLDAMEPVVTSLRSQGRLIASSYGLRRAIGASLQARSHATARVQVEDKPDLLWDHPELERLYTRLSDEYELAERHATLDRKLTLIGESTGTLVSLIDARRSRTLEIAVVVLIGMELLAAMYELLFK